MSPAQRAQILYLHHVEGVSIVLLAARTGLSRSQVQKVLHDAHRQDVPAARETAPRHAVKGHIERPVHFVREHLLCLLKGAGS